MNYCTVVTGAASGIGYATACKLLDLGTKVLAVDVDGERLTERFAARERVVTLECDLLSADAVESVAQAAKAHFDGVGGFVHAAGFDEPAPLGMVSAQGMQRLFALHAGFPVRFLGWLARKTNHALPPQMTSCVLISSLAAHEGAKGHAAYAAAKGAVEGFLRPAAAELADKNIRLNAVVLGIVETEMSANWLNKLTSEQLSALRGDYPLGFGQPAAVAETICFLLGDSARWITGQTLVCDGGHGLR